MTQTVSATKAAAPSVIERPSTDELVDQRSSDGDHDRFAHYVNKVKLTESAVTGNEVIALCGKKWIPNRDPQKFKVCPTCKQIYENLPK